ncbi:hypothetical protein AYR62_14485 [Secundilactobacillus paracollinoides]|uniref:Uncharacterized protein n=1 Tax=Secundilactobacillus paracollinoides TaxID=240427 RepID=A0A1B2IX29_9LACO|nr:hypothetical protein [Secundilactobacillus paracollinoides]ANZ65164.1 hypothetical protein AYR62_14485 [Secundilactobacillus paracollinoides]ANZ66636.1 hypothetical protein AYR63_05475 [Secundilactobacillus paracollinoides]
MAQSGVVVFDELSDSAKQRAVTDFCNFYLKEFKGNNLEIIANFPIQYEVEQLNHDIQDNRSLQPEELQDFLLENDNHLLGKVLAAFNLSFLENGALADTTYEAWYQTQYDQIQKGL